jgi:uncharacterized membrane protein
MIKLEYVYVLAGLMFGSYAIINLLDRTNTKRIKNFLFWGIYACTFLFGSELSNFTVGCAAISLALIAGFGGLGMGTADPAPSAARRRDAAVRFGNKLFIPALIIPCLTVVGTLFFKYVVVNGEPLVSESSVTFISLGFSIVVAFVVSRLLLRTDAMASLIGARRTMDSISWAAILPQMLAALGIVFVTAGVGKEVASIVQRWVALDSPMFSVAAYTFGMAVFTMVMGNAFAAFPVMTSAFGLPLIVHHFGGNPAVMGSIGMLSGFCGTLMTPMAANFNIVPAALLELQDKNGVIKAQLPTALILLVLNTFVMYIFVFHKF